MKEELHVWIQFLESFTGVSFWKTELCLEAEFQVQTDAAGSLGFSIHFYGRLCAGVWPTDWREQGVSCNLTFLDLFFPVVGSLWLWGET